MLRAGHAKVHTDTSVIVLLGGTPMKRLVLLFDGTWNTLGKPDEATNGVRVGQAIKPIASDGVPQIVYYNSGVGSGGKIDQILGGVFGAGIRSNVQRGLTFLSFNYDSGEPEVKTDPWGKPDEIYIFGFSRGAYTARALAGVIGAIRGIPRVSNFGEVEQLWAHYKKSEKGREKHKKRFNVEDKIYPRPPGGKLIKCVAVWDTVGSYGIPTGLGLGGLARWITSWTRNFSDNHIGRRIEYGFHAMAIDERRRAFTATAWEPRAPRPPDAKPPEVPEAVVEQIWFAGAHANVGGGYSQTGLSDHALLWIMGRVQDQTGLEFQESYISENFFPCSACSAYRSYRGWWVSSLWPAIRSIPKRLAAAGTRGIIAEPGQAPIIDGRLHWSVKERYGKLALVDQNRYAEYRPAQIDPNTSDSEYTVCEGKEYEFVHLARHSGENKRRSSCALHCELGEIERQWFGGRRRARRMRNLREKWQALIATSKPDAM
jgi:uncharacterized protein (DUF2235 family)